MSTFKTLGSLLHVSRSIPTKKKARHSPSSSTIKSLPHYLLLEVVSRVVLHSFYDILNAKLICKYFLNVAKDDYVFQHVSMDKFPLVPWIFSEESSLFINRFLENGNLEALGED
ncbi:hypothetical protein CFOL_v3_18378 [Cephalotus follicularis]|uniref:F-box domain-containing protein n=1 Tax=Cephalotus follicularis TaxID=3775 RepID=A0A1Q3C495_CEPFO|nr:hypothetical protein CFOL_v3_18378 [Cephalotus follicularis]